MSDNETDFGQFRAHLLNATLANKTLSVATIVGIAHIISGLCVFMDHNAILVTPLYFLYDVATYSHLHIHIAAIIMIMTGWLAIMGSLYGAFLTHRLHILCFLPQQILLFLQIVGITKIFFTGVYPDGYQPHGEGWFILADQIWVWLLATSHTLWLWFLIITRRKL